MTGDPTHGDERAAATEPLRSEASLGELFTEMSSELSQLFREELELAKTEARDEARHLGKVAGMFGGAGLSGWLAILFLSFALAWLLDRELGTDLSFLIVGLIWAIAAAVLYTAARNRLERRRAAMEQTRKSLKEDVEWARAQRS